MHFIVVCVNVKLNKRVSRIKKMMRLSGKCTCKEKVTLDQLLHHLPHLLEKPSTLKIFSIISKFFNRVHTRVTVFKISSSTTKYSDLDSALCLELRKIVEALAAPGKGLLAADETPAVFDEKFQLIDLENTEFSRRDYRQMIFSTFELSEYISGIILHHETVYQKTSDNIDFVELLRQMNIVPGVKVDRGPTKIFGTDNENTTEGLDNLQERCIQYKKDGCHFTKWRCTFSISEKTPSRLAMLTNANSLARYASISQSARMVPILEAEILNEGQHGVNRAMQVHEEMLSILFHALNEHHVYIEGMILKPSMVLSGIQSMINCKPQIIAEHTITALQRTVPPAVPVIFFLSGGQSEKDAVLNLNAINLCEGKKPWTLSFCYDRALQDSAMQIWRGDPANVEKAQSTLLERARLCSEASRGKLQLEEIDKCVKSISSLAEYEE